MTPQYFGNRNEQSTSVGDTSQPQMNVNEILQVNDFTYLAVIKIIRVKHSKNLLLLLLLFRL